VAAACAAACAWTHAGHLFALHCLAGSKYEAALRKQHSSLNPRTAWASAPKSAGSNSKRRGAATKKNCTDDSGSEQEQQEPSRDGLEGLMMTAGLLGAARPMHLPHGSIETSRLKVSLT
jgi:hypothetical protein